ncbi:MAG: cell division protein FtsQ/DivIB [Pseudomonadota bacterium]
MRSVGPPRGDPAPSRWAWRLQRLLLTPGVRLFLHFGLPIGGLALGILTYIADPDRRLAIVEAVAEARARMEERPEFMVKLMAIDGAEGVLAANIREVVAIDFPISSFDLDLQQLRRQVVALNEVRSATVRIRPGGILDLAISRRVPVAAWRHRQGLSLIDEEGIRIRDIDRRSAYPDLPLITGVGAPQAIAEALTLVSAAEVLDRRFRGLVRVGERRWDIVLDRDQRIMLPATGALQAFERVIALEAAEDLLSRDVTHVDMRLTHRPTIRISGQAAEKTWKIRRSSNEDRELR